MILALQWRPQIVSIAPQKDFKVTILFFRCNLHIQSLLDQYLKQYRKLVIWNFVCFFWTVFFLIISRGCILRKNSIIQLTQNFSVLLKIVMYMVQPDPNLTYWITWKYTVFTDSYSATFREQKMPHFIQWCTFPCYFTRQS